VAEELVSNHQLPIRRACQIVKLSRAAYYRHPRCAAERDAAVIQALNQVVARRSRWGFWKCFDRLRLDGYAWNHKRVHRVYCAMRLNLPRRTKKRLPKRTVCPLSAPSAHNRIWAMDFMHDTLYGGRRFRTLNVLDEANREALGIEVGTSIPSARVIRVLDRLIDQYGRPEAIRMDNGPEFTAAAFEDWCEKRGIARLYIEPGKPDQNAFIERFNRTYREEMLDAYLFASIQQVRLLTDEWLADYNTERPHDSLGRVPPLTYLPRQTLTGVSSNQVST
jgi:putative transposase